MDGQLKYQRSSLPYHTKKDEISIEADCSLWGIGIIIPKAQQPQTLQTLHEGHPGIQRMKAIARSYMWWNGMDQDIERQAKTCQACQENRSNPPSAPLHIWQWPTAPLKRIHIDFAGPFQGKMFLIIVDAHSKWPEVIVMPSTTSQRTIEVLSTYFARYGLPEQLVTDNRPPTELFLGRKVQTKLDLLKPKIAEAVENKQLEQKKHHDRHSKLRSFSDGQTVSVRDYLSSKKWVSGVITSILGPTMYKVKLPNGSLVVRHVDQLRDRLQADTNPQQR